VNVGDVVVDEDEDEDKDEYVGMVAEGRDEEDEEMIDVVGVESVVLGNERTGGAVPFRTGMPLVSCQ
jgi:hypothetical protein